MAFKHSGSIFTANWTVTNHNAGQNATGYKESGVDIDDKYELAYQTTCPPDYVQVTGKMPTTYKRGALEIPNEFHVACQYVRP